MSKFKKYWLQIPGIKFVRLMFNKIKEIFENQNKSVQNF